MGWSQVCKHTTLNPVERFRSRPPGAVTGARPRRDQGNDESGVDAGLHASRQPTELTTASEFGRKAHRLGLHSSAGDPTALTQRQVPEPFP